MQATMTLIVLALATLGDMTQIGLFLFMSLRQGGQGKYCFMSLSLATTTALSRNLCKCKHSFNNHGQITID
jgi:hypothetical protein